jgi:hypothetical protein
MPLNLASPGIRVREVDLTTGRVDPTSARIGALVAPFAQGPVDLPTLIGSEKNLLDNFGKPYNNDKHYEHWLTASSFLAYGGQMRVVRVDDDDLKNAVSNGSAIKIKNIEHYEQLQYDENIIAGGQVVVSKNPGSWANGIRIGIIDGLADQTLTVSSTSGLSVGLGVSQAVPANTQVSGTGDASGTVVTIDGYYKGIITGVDSSNNKINVKFVSHVSAAGTETTIDYTYNGKYKFSTGTTDFIGAGAGSTSVNITRGALGSSAASATAGDSIDAYFLSSSLVVDNAGGLSLSDTGTSIGIATAGVSVGAGNFLVIGSELISLASATVGVGQITGITRGAESTVATEHVDGATVKYLTKTTAVATVTADISGSATNVGLTTTATGLGTDRVNVGGFLQIGSEFVSVSAFLDGNTSQQTVSVVADWFDAQELHVSKEVAGNTTTVKTIKWNTVAERPGTSQYASDRGSRFDELHVVVIDGEGKITGNAGTILEKHLNLSKAKDATFSVGSPSYWRKYLQSNSSNIFAGGAPTGLAALGFSSGFTAVTDTGWDQTAEDAVSGPIIFGGTGTKNYTLTGGLDYDGGSDIEASGALAPSLDKLVSGYNIFENTENYSVDFLIMGSANYGSAQAAALATKLIAVADKRKDALAFISPYRGAFLSDSAVGTVTVNNDETITDNVLGFYGGMTSSSYAIFDSGYKYMYDRFANTFRYVPLNGDIAGLCARNDIDNFPWFSPAGTTRGAILNAVKLAYNPSQEQRDRLYSARVNPVIFSPGSGIVLFGDKTGLAKSSAFDRINVRRLFIYLEDAISAAARDQLFEFNDEITRTNFVNIVEPFLRDVQAKRGIQDYVVICDETNNTAAIIDNNEFIADIYIKPARSINFIGLTFVATRTGVSFEEVIGNV